MGVVVVTGMEEQHDAEYIPDAESEVENADKVSGALHYGAGHLNATND